MRPVVVMGAAVLAVVAATGTVLASTITAHVGSYYFEDSTVGDGKIVVNKGDQIKFVVDDGGRDGKPHSVVVTALGIDSGSLLGGSTYVTPVLNTPGTYTLFCKFHRVSQNHQTQLIVTGAAATPKPTPAPTPRPSPTRAPAGQTPGASSGGTSAPGSTPKPSGGTSTTAPNASNGAIESAPQASFGGTPGPIDSASGTDPSAGPIASDEGPLPPGVTGPPTLVWLRSVLVGGLVVPGLVIIAGFAWLTATRRRTRSGE